MAILGVDKFCKIILYAPIILCYGINNEDGRKNSMQFDNVTLEYDNFRNLKDPSLSHNKKCNTSSDSKLCANASYVNVRESIDINTEISVEIKVDNRTSPEILKSNYPNSISTRSTQNVNCSILNPALNCLGLFTNESNSFNKSRNNLLITYKPYSDNFTHSNITESNEKSRKKPLVTLDTLDQTVGAKIQDDIQSPESKYIIPVVAFILIIPLLIVLVLFSYRQMSDCWERRHYRQMDFLIDGMYND